MQDQCLRCARSVRAFHALATQAVPLAPVRPSDPMSVKYDTADAYAHAVRYFELTMVALQLLSALTTDLCTGVDTVPVYHTVLNEGLDVDKLNIPRITYAVRVYYAPDADTDKRTDTDAGADTIVPDVTFWSRYIERVLLVSLQNGDGTRALYYAALLLQTLAMGPMALCALRCMNAKGMSGMVVQVLQAHLYALAGQPEHGTVGDYRPSAASARPSLYAAVSADVEAAAQVKHVPPAALQHLRTYAGPFSLLYMEGRAARQEALTTVQETYGVDVYTCIREALDVAGSRAVHATELLDVRHMDFQDALLDVTEALDDMCIHADRVYLQEDLFKEDHHGLADGET